MADGQDVNGLAPVSVVDLRIYDKYYTASALGFQGREAITHHKYCLPIIRVMHSCA